MTKLRTLLSLLTALFVAACSTAGSSSWNTGDDAMRRGEYELAIIRYERAAVVRPNDESLQARILDARRMAVEMRLEHARSARASGDLVAAENQLLAAERILPKDAEIATLTADVASLKATYAEERRRIEAAMAEATTALEETRPDDARRVLARWLDSHPAHPGLFELATRADSAARDLAIDAAREALAAERFDDALATAQRAAAVKPLSQRATRLIAQAERGRRAATLVEEANRLLAANRHREAAVAFDRALTEHPGYSVARDGLARAQNAGALANLDQARTALADRRLDEAAERVAAARRLDPSAAGLDDISNRIVDARLSSHATLAEAHAGAGRVALAYLHRRAAARLRPDDGALRATAASARRKVGELLALRVVTPPFRDGTGRGADTLGLSQGVLARLGAPDALPPGVTLAPEDDAADWRIEGTLVDLRDSTSRPIVRTRSVRYVERVELVDNPRSLALERELDRLEVEADLTADRLEDERARYRILLRNPPYADGRRGGAHRDAHRRAAYDGALLTQRSRIRREERALEEVEAQLATTRDLLDTTPPTLERPIEATHRYRETTVIVSGRAKLELRLIGPDGLAAEDTAAAGFSEEDTEVPVFEPAGIAPDALELPTGDQIEARLFDELTQTTARSIQRLLGTLARRHLPSSGATGDEALEKTARFLLAGGEGEEASALRERLRNETGLSIGGESQ